MDRGWIQFLLVVVPVLSLIGSWLALRAIAERRDGRPNADSARGRGENETQGKANER